ncbi:hypothetical protein [uncultured Paraglaciecola sp.]|uniref:hypothetical protein n=1 Tax=uncultured Paraglaciecola sp. TaxID=1765024 RepID=UPI0030D81FF1|tara:strand:- start:20750 stop:22015 length:1266 start_codon:yes stop_codon:yes gene_type:complete
MAKTYTDLMKGGSVDNFVPSIDLGAFDVQFDMVKKKMNVLIKFALKAGTVPPGGGQLYQANEVAQLNQQRFAKAYVKQIPTAWNGKAKFVSTKQDQGWKDLTIEPTFKVQQAPLASAHYEIEVIPESVEQHTLRDPTGIVTPLPINTNAGFQARQAYMGSESITNTGMKNYGQNMRWDLDKGVSIPLEFLAMATVWSPDSDASGWSRLRAYVRNTERFKVPRKFRSSTRPKVKLIGSGMGSDNSNIALARNIHDHLKTVGFKSPVTYESGVTNGEKNIELKMDKTELKQLFPPRTAEKNSLYKQITTAHEFGHMLGLPDEYLCMHQRTQDAMSEVYSDRVTQSLIGNAGNAITDDATKHIVVHQGAYVKLCAEAGVVAPPFNRLSSSIMSNGMVLHPWHYVTLWECLKDFSETSDWKIVMN